MKQILVVNINWLGDAVFSTPVFKSLKAAYPQAQITCLCVPRVKEVMSFCPYVDHLMTVDEKHLHRWPWQQWALVQLLRRKKFDAAFLLHGSMTRSLFVFLAGIPLRVGFCKWPFLLTHPVKMNPEGIHRVDYYLKVLEAFGVPIYQRTYELRLAQGDQGRLRAFLSKSGIGIAQKYIVLNTGGNWNLKRWSTDSWAQLARRLNEEFGLTIIFSGSMADRDLSQGIIQLSGIRAYNLAGQTNLGESLVLYHGAEVVISGDSGPLHLAHSVGADVIALFGPTRPEITGPRGIGLCEILFQEIGCNKAPCYHLTCANNMCMKLITVDNVCQAFKKIKKIKNENT